MQSLFGGGEKRHFNPFDYEKLNPKLLRNSGIILFVCLCWYVIALKKDIMNI